MTIILVIIGAVSYAFFVTDTSDNRNQEVVLTAGTMRLRFADNDNGVNASLNFGESAVKYFVIENTGTLDAKAKINFTSMINTYLKGSLTYKLEYKTSEANTDYIEVQESRKVPQSTEASTYLLAKDLLVPVGATYYYRLTVTLENLDDIDQTPDVKAYFSTMFNLEESEYQNTGWMQDAVMAVYNDRRPEGVNTGNPNFAAAATTDEGVFSLEDDYGTSYYYRGAVEDNYIKFANFYWRIIRINGDASLRIIYDGTKGYVNGEINNDRYAIIGQAWNTQHNDNKYVGWMFGGAQGETSTSKEQAQRNETNSDAKTAVDTWYKENIEDKGYGKYVSDEIFCNDRSTPGKDVTGYSKDTGLGYAKNATAYGATSRASTYNSVIPQPKFTCEIKNDAFTVEESEKGNGSLTYPVGLIMADEILAAGSGKNSTKNVNYYLYKSSNYFGYSLSADVFYDSTYANVFGIYTSGQLSGNYSVHYTNGALAPVINLSAEYASTLVGDGTITNPYRDASDTV